MAPELADRDVVRETVALLADDSGQPDAPLTPDEVRLAEALARGLSNRRPAPQ